MLLTLLSALAASQGVVNPQITVDQFGWQQGAKKVAVFADPINGQNADRHWTPGPVFEVCRAKDDSVAFKGKLAAWNDGKVSEIAGDRVWFAGFTSVKEPGTYYLFDPKTEQRSYPFRIADDVYGKVLVDAERMFYYQRSGTPILAKFGGQWNHPGGHMGPGQDSEAHLSQNGQDMGMPRNVLGGWYDAGDPNKYVPFLESTIFNLLWAYERNPKAFGDANNIPESGNGVPDILDEAKWELDWVLKMQDPDGGVHNRNADRTYNMPLGPWSVDVQPRFYTAKTTWATAVAAASFARASREFAPFGKVYIGYSAKLKAAALSACGYLEKHPTMDPADGKDGDSKLAAAGGDSNPNADRRDRIYAAAELFKTTGDPKFGAYVEKWATDIDATNENGLHPFKNNWVDPLNHHALTQALFVYSTTPGANDAIVQRFKQAIRSTAESIRTATGGPDDPYLCYHFADHYCWGSNQSKGSWGRILLMAIDLGVAPEHDAEYKDIVAGYVHFIDGRNPLSWCYLTNMGHAGASHSVMRPFHKWFGSMPAGPDGQKPAPAPGFLVGGPNKAFSVPWIKPPYGEPAMKAYKDWDASWNNERQASEASWEVTEPAIYYQAGFVLILSSLMR